MANYSDGDGSQPTDDLFKELYLIACKGIVGADWHYLKYLFSFVPPHPVAAQIVMCAVECEKGAPGLGQSLIKRIVSFGGREKNTADYEAILQVMSEMLVLAQAFKLPWPDDVVFIHEPKGRTGKRPELLVRCENRTFLFEVKAPSLLKHRQQRNNNSWQIPGRSLSRSQIEKLAQGEPVTMPRDNPVKDFLISADEKFADFERQPGGNILFIVWDDHIYEPITSLVNERSGLLTENSYVREAGGAARIYRNVDAVIVIRHLLYFQLGLAEEPLLERKHLFDFGREGDLPNVYFPTGWGREAPDFIVNGFRALDHRDPFLQRAADYRPQEVIMWI